jgi:hypothetical protein
VKGARRGDICTDVPKIAVIAWYRIAFGEAQWRNAAGRTRHVLEPLGAAKNSEETAGDNSGASWRKPRISAAKPGFPAVFFQIISG